MRPIDADRLKDNFPNLHKGVEWQIKDGYFSPQYVALMIDEAPTIGAATVTTCVECRNCESGYDEVKSWQRCRILKRDVDAGFFCGYADKRA